MNGKFHLLRDALETAAARADNRVLKLFAGFETGRHKAATPA